MAPKDNEQAPLQLIKPKQLGGGLVAVGCEAHLRGHRKNVCTPELCGGKKLVLPASRGRPKKGEKRLQWSCRLSEEQRRDLLDGKEVLPEWTSRPLLDSSSGLVRPSARRVNQEAAQSTAGPDFSGLLQNFAAQSSQGNAQVPAVRPRHGTDQGMAQRMGTATTPAMASLSMLGYFQAYGPAACHQVAQPVACPQAEQCVGHIDPQVDQGFDQPFFWGSGQALLPAAGQQVPQRLVGPQVGLLADDMTAAGGQADFQPICQADVQPMPFDLGDGDMKPLPELNLGPLPELPLDQPWGLTATGNDGFVHDGYFFSPLAESVDLPHGMQGRNCDGQ